GGGVCMELELAWGWLRRAWLRRFRPGYVRRMLSLRQGVCQGCPHEVIDPRDLKYRRNVCGYWFRPADDRFRWRDRLGFARMGLVELILFSTVCGTLATLFALLAANVSGLLWIPFAATLLGWAEVVYFFRDPARAVPGDPAALLSPADGTVTHV